MILSFHLCMEILSCVNISSSLLSVRRLNSIATINGYIEDLEFCLPSPEERPDNVEHPWTCYFENQIKSRLCIPPPLSFQPWRHIMSIF